MRLVMIKKIYIFTVVFMLLYGNIWAGGNREGNESRTAEDPAGFSDSFDITRKRTGKFNYYIEAKDRAGNSTLAGPENIFIDPSTDLPQVMIVNPTPNLRVRGNLNIVGIAFDDDGIEKVELVVTRSTERGTKGRGEELVRAVATGKDYWTYFLDTTDKEIWTDGHYIITAWATDINGLSGISSAYPTGGAIKKKEQRRAVMNWHLDRKDPETVITSHQIGDLVSGHINMSGYVTDGNGIRSFAYSTDNEENYIPIKPKLHKKSGENRWKVIIPKRILEDGPAVIWFRGVDTSGSVGRAAHLLFANNTPPEIKLVYPPANVRVNGMFSMAGYVKHPIGVTKITWRAGKERGTIDLLPGNNWWSVSDIDINNHKSRDLEIEIRAVDVSGNTSVLKRKIRITHSANVPTVRLTSPRPGITDNDLGILVKGTAADDDGIAYINYSLNGVTAAPIPCNGDFQFVISTPKGGVYNIEVWATDFTGLNSNRVSVKGIMVPGDPVVAEVESITSGKNVRPFSSGMIVNQVPIMNNKGRQRGAEKLVMQIKAPEEPASATIQIGDSKPLRLRFERTRSRSYYALVPLKNLPEGLVKIVLRTNDKQGRSFEHVDYIFYNSYRASLNDVETEPFFDWVLGGDKNPEMLPDGRISIKDDAVLVGMSSVPIRNVTITGSPNLVLADDRAPNQVKIRAVQGGDLGQFSLRFETDQGVQQLGPFRVLAGFDTPVINITGNEENNFVKESTPLRFTVTGNTRIASVDYSLDMGDTWTSFGAIAAEYNRNLDISEMPDGYVTILIRAVNDAGKTAVSTYVVQKDSIPPSAQIIMPTEGEKVNGTIRLAFEIEEAGSLSTIVYHRPARAGGVQAITRELFNASSWDKKHSMRFIEVTMDSQTPLDDQMRFIFTDNAGNSSEITEWSFIIDPQSDIPVVQISLPDENDVVTSDFIASGVMFDDDGISHIQWRIDNGQWQTLEAKNGFMLPISISNLSDNAHTLSIIAEDIYGVRSEPYVRNFRVSLAEPTAVVSTPSMDEILKDAIEIRGSSFDRNGIKEVKVSVDNGNTFNPVMGNFGTMAETVPWSYQFNTKILKDGAHAVFIQVVDNCDVPAIYATMINVDNTAPDIMVEGPVDGAQSTGKITVLGRVLDDNLKDITIQLRSFDGQTVSNALRTRTLEPTVFISEDYDLTGQADGNYNLTITGTDKAGNITHVSRNFELARQSFKNYLEVLYPLENETVSGEFNLYGYAGGADKAGSATVRINGTDVITNDVDDTGYFRFNLLKEHFTEGNNSIIVHSNFGGSSQVSSRAYNINYISEGPWVTIDSFTFGDFAYERPFFFGRAGYSLSDEDKVILANKKRGNREARAVVLEKRLQYTEISFDNGRTFVKTKNGKKRKQDYSYRLETSLMPEGMHYIIVRSTMRNGETAVSRMVIHVDKTAPEIKLMSPELGGRYNSEIAYAATATDDVDLVSLTYHLRRGDKSSYGIPAFLQGLYLEVTIPPVLRQMIVSSDLPNMNWTSFLGGGATYMDVGLGLSFFNDNVKVQAQFGFITQDIYESLGGTRTPPIRYGGNVLGLKILANVYNLPFGPILGPSWDWLSASFSLGASFSLFNLGNQENPYHPNVFYTQSGQPTWLSALLLQIEFPKMTVPKWKSFRRYSVFTEGQLWFIPTDVDYPVAIIQPKVILGIRIYAF